MSRGYGHIITAFYGQPWAILPTKLAEIEAFLLRRVRGDEKDICRVAFDDGPTPPRQAGPGYQLLGSAAVVKVHGTIVPRASLFSEWSGGTSAEAIGRAVESAAADPKAEAIVLDVDSPGGYVAGVPEAADKILAARKTKPVYAVANHTAASAAYWLASQASDLAVAPSGEVGSIGVLAAHVDQTKLEEMMGVKTTLITSGASPHKTEGYPQVPLTDEARADMQASVDYFAKMFIGAVAKGRGVKAAKVEKDFGGGRMKVADDALAAGMVNRIATLEQVVAEVNGQRRARGARARAADLAAAGLPTS